MPRHKKHFISKWASDWIATGANMVKWKLRYKSNCPHCLQSEETTDHILHCKNEEVGQRWETKLKEFDEKLRKIRTCNRLRQAIIRELKGWRLSKLPNLPVHYDDELRMAIREQRRIGWRNFLEGLISKKNYMLSTELL